jgi:RHS repeat-associated protein
LNQTRLFFLLIFISLEDEPWEPIEPNPNAAPAEEPDIEEQDLSQSDWTLASTETVTHEYLTQNGKVARETIRQDVGGTVLSTKTLDFFYDDSGRPFAFNYSVDGGIASTYYYILNLQGDVVQIIDANGVMQAEYVYSPWGEIISAEGDLAEINPLRYRGYYYDSETGFYYLQSRYYDPENHRFINADTAASTGQGFIGTNMFAYCLNIPNAARDTNGRDTEIVLGSHSYTYYFGGNIVTVDLSVSVPLNRYKYAAVSFSEDSMDFSLTLDAEEIEYRILHSFRSNFEDYTVEEAREQASLSPSPRIDSALTLSLSLVSGLSATKTYTVDDKFNVNTTVSVVPVSFWEKVCAFFSKTCPGMADGAPTGGGMDMMYSGGGGVYASFGGLNPMMKKICSFM